MVYVTDQLFSFFLHSQIYTYMNPNPSSKAIQKTSFVFDDGFFKPSTLSLPLGLKPHAFMGVYIIL